MLPHDLPGNQGPILSGDTNLINDLRAWSLGREGAGSQRRLVMLGDALHERTIGLGLRDTPNVIAAGASATVDLLSRHPISIDPNREMAFINVFSNKADPNIAPLRATALDALTRGAVGIALSGSKDESIINALLATSFGADRASAALRALMLGKPVPDFGEQLPFIPNDIIDSKTLERLVLWGTLQDYLRALSRAGAAWRAYADWVSRAIVHAKGISRLEPNHGCAGSKVIIWGEGFPKSLPPYTSVQFPNESGHCSEAKFFQRPGGALSWSNTKIEVIAPEDVGIGCVGFLVTDGPAPALADTDLGAAAGMLQSVLGDIFGPVGVLYGQAIVDGVRDISRPQFPCPPCLPPVANGVIPNRYVGGKPVIHQFTVNGASSVQIHTGDSINLAWEVEGADSITITARTAQSSPWAAHLPSNPAVMPDPAKGTTGPIVVTWEGIDDWDGEYVLTATNTCATVRAVLKIEMRESPPLFGIADTHVHFVSHLGFGGYGPWGRPHASDPALTGDAAVADALPWCDGPRGHGPGGILPSLEGAGGHLVGGFDQFDGWPRHTTLAHQQAYIDWIKRAVDGGLRLAVCFAVNNELLATRMTELYGTYLPIDDMNTITRQLDAMASMVQFVDNQAGGPGQGWIEIAKTSADARRIVASGKLALVLGVEVDSLGGWHTPAALEADAQAQGRTPQELIVEMIQDLYDRGVRHVFPVHASNNAFGGPALFIRNYDATNYFLTGQSFDVAHADQALGISYRLDEDDFEGGKVAEVLGYYGVAAAKAVGGAALTGLTLGGFVGGIPGGIGGAAIGAGVAAAQYPCPPQPTNWAGISGGHINAQELTEYGEILVNELMRHGMLIDIDHMGHKTTERVLELCEPQQYPIISGHTGFRELKYGWPNALADDQAQYSKTANANDFGTLNVKRLSSEVDKTPDHLQRIHALGGMVSPILYQRDVRDCGCSHGFMSYIANDNAGSSKSLALAFLYAHHHMHGRHVGFGSDINGAAQLPGPRFGPQGAAAISDERDWKVREANGWQLRIDQVFAQHDGVHYSTPIKDYRHYRFMDYSGHPDKAPFDAEQRDFWESIAIWRTGTAPENADQPPLVQRTIATQNFIINLATGLRATSRAEIPISISFPLSKPWPFYNVNTDEQLAAYLASHADTDSVRSTDPTRTQELFPKLLKVWKHWQAMEKGASGQATDTWTQRLFGPSGSRLYDANGNLTRSIAGRRDFDINIDGMAHYGLLPDLFQDMRNVGVRLEDLATLYRSAEDYIRVWERCEAKRLP